MAVSGEFDGAGIVAAAAGTAAARNLRRTARGSRVSSDVTLTDWVRGPGGCGVEHPNVRFES